jgi:peptide/nickel transport system permease protein
MMIQKHKGSWGHYLAWTLLVLYLAVACLTQGGWLAKDWDSTKGDSYQSPCWSAESGDEKVSSSSSSASRSSSLSAMEITPDDPLAPALRKIIPELSAAQLGHLLIPAVRERCAVFGFDRWGRNVLSKVLQGTRTSMIVGLGSTFLAITVGTLLGALAGFYAGSLLDKLLNAIYNIFTAVPNLLLILAIAALLQQRGWVPMVLILGLTGWTGVFRLLRAEYIKHRSRDYVLAASLLGASPIRRMFQHILPNTVHLIGVQAAILTVGFIKSEVILSFLGLGVGVEEVSWGTLLNEAQTELLFGFPWQLIAATLAMSVLTIALSRLSDDYTDPVSSVRA